MTLHFNLSRGGRWITFGGSYSGELAAWARLKYPHLFWAAVASSAPVSAQVDYGGYDPIVSAALRRDLVGGSDACHNAVKEAFQAFEMLLERDRARLKTLFNTCGAVQTDGDAYLLHDYVSDDFMGLVQYNEDVEGMVNIRSRCRQMLNSSVGATPLDRLVAITQERASGACIFDTDGSGVTDSISFAAHLQGYTNVSNPGRSFTYQMCADGVGHDQTCKPELGCIFSPKYGSRRFFQQQCSNAFNVSAVQTDAAARFNSLDYGGNETGGSRMLFVNGDVDPFHYGSVTRNSSQLLSQDVVALMIQGGSHCQDMGRYDPLRDSVAMAEAKRGKAATVARWLTASALGDTAAAASVVFV